MTIADGVGARFGRLPAQVIELRPPAAAHRPGRPDPPAAAPFENLTRLAAAALDAASAFVAVLGHSPLFGANQLDAGDPLDRRDAAQRSFCRTVIAAGSELLVRDARPAAEPGGGAGDLVSWAADLVSWAGIPVRDEAGQVVGAVCVADRRPRRWTARETDLLGELARTAARELALLADLDSARRFAAEHEALARTLQESLLPPWLPQIPGMELASRYVAGGAGVDVLGDFFDVFPSVRGSWGVVVGDVCGKGVPAAKSTALARYTLRAEAHRESRPSLILSALNRALLDWPTEDPRFLSAIYATVRPTPAGAAVQISSAGHPLGLVHRADGRVCEIGRPGGLLGLFPDPELFDSRANLRAGDSLILFTDGITEARRPTDCDLFGDARLRTALTEVGDRSAAQIADSVQQAARAFGGTPASDDTVVLVLKAMPWHDPADESGAGGGAAAGRPAARWNARDRPHITIPGSGLGARAGRNANGAARPA
jgi:phosphoserine phosphatase RsbU/P